MKRNDTGAFCVLYVEPSDERAMLFNAIVGQHKPVVIMLSEQARVMQRPDDYAMLKKLKRQHDVPVLFVVPDSKWGRRVTHLATRSGFTAYPSLDALLQAQEQEQVVRLTQQLTQEGGYRSPVSHPAHMPRPVRAHTSPVIAPAFPLPDTAPLHPLSSPVFTPDADARHYHTGYVMEREDIGDNIGDIEDIEDEPTHPPMSSARQSANMRQVSTSRPVRPVAPPMSARKTRDLSPEMMDVMLDTHNKHNTHDIQNTQRRQSTFSPVAAPVTPIPPVQPVSPAAPAPVAPPVNIHKQGRRNRFPAILIVLTLIMLIGAGLGYALLLYHPLVTPPVVMGHLSFLSSEQLNENSNQGIDDEAQLDMSNVANPAPHKSYYAWLLADQGQGEGQAILLGVLPVHNGSIHLFYPGDAQHTNLLATMSRLLITEEDATVTPIAPSPDDSTWQYYGGFGTMPVTGTDTQGNVKHFSYLDHLRHLLASDPLLDQMELPGGLNNWLYRNSGKVLEWTSSLREQWQETQNVTFLRNQTIRTLAYLDGLSYVRQDVPASIPLGVNDRLARVGILDVNGPTQAIPAYLDHIVTHLNGLLQASNPGGTPNEQLKKNVAAIIDALSNVRLDFTKVRQDAQQLLKMSDAQLRQPQTLSLLNDMIANTNAAYIGQPDPNTGEMYQGITWIHSQIQSLATLDILVYNVNNSNVQMIQDMKRHS